MRRVLVLAERPFRDLRSRAILADLPARFPTAAPLLLATGAPTAPDGFVPCDPDVVPPAIDHVVLAGAFTEARQIEAALGRAGQAVAAGATLEGWRLSLENRAAGEVPASVAVLDAAEAIVVRDYHSANALLLWRVAAHIRIDAYPERTVAPDETLAVGLPAGPLLGLAVLGGDNLQTAWMARLESFRAQLAPVAGWPILPLPCEAARTPQDDYAGSLAFAAAVLPGAPMLLPRLADPVWRRRQLSPARLKGLVARCGAVLTMQDLPAAYAVACGIPVLGLVLDNTERRAVSCLTQLANDLPPGSALLYPPVSR